MLKASAPSRTTLATLMLVLAVGVAPAAATTTTVSLGGGGFTVRVTDEPAEEQTVHNRNLIHVSEDANNLLVTDISQSVDVVAGPGCFLQTTERVACPRDPSNSANLEITSGYGHDQISIDLPARPMSGVASVDVYGGPGNDILVGGDFGETLDGDGRHGNGAPFGEDPANLALGREGNDVIFGGGGPDTLIGRGGDDYLNGGHPAEIDTAPNTLDGGPGADFFDAGGTLGPDHFIGGSGGDDPRPENTLSRVLLDKDQAGRINPQTSLPNNELAQVFGGDTVSFGTRTYSEAGTAGVVANLDGLANDGAAGEGDRIGSDVEALVGSIRDDTLTGSAGANRIEGRLGFDTMLGGAGPDKMMFRDGVPDRCFVIGEGDTVDLDLTDPSAVCQPKKLPIPFRATVGAKPVDETMPYVRIGARLRGKAAGRLLARVRCPRGADRTCTGSLAVLRALGGRAALARRRFRARPGRATRVALRLPPSRVAGLQRRGHALLRTVSQGTSTIGPTTTTVARRLR